MNTAIILAAGRGTRLGSETPKQFLLLGSEPLICRTVPGKLPPGFR
ncbi:MAG: 2-C-methyl-D-erythritol 4-phosphate cytidylyltransferase [bacterium]